MWSSDVSPSQQFPHFNAAPVSEDVSPAPAGTHTTTITVTEYVTLAPVIESNRVSQFQQLPRFIMTAETADVGRGLPQRNEDQIVDIPATPVPVIDYISPAPPVADSSPEYIAPAPPTADSSPESAVTSHLHRLS